MNGLLLTNNHGRRQARLLLQCNAQVVIRYDKLRRNQSHIIRTKTMRFADRLETPVP